MNHVALPGTGTRSEEGAVKASPHLDALRLIAAFAIVVLHYSSYVGDTAVGRFIVEHSDHVNLFVDLFFVISGFVIAAQYSGRVGDRYLVGRFLWRRFARIYPLHAATLTFYLAIAILLHLGYIRVENPARYSLADVPVQIFLLHAIDGARLTFNFPSWSLSAEMVCYLLFPLAAFVGIRRPVLVIVLAVAVATTLTLYVTISGTTPWTDWINRGGAFRALPAFFLGVSLYLFRDRICGLEVSALLLPTLLVFLAVGWALPGMAAVGLVYLVAIIAVHCDQAKARTVIAQLEIGRWANLTYSVYMLHMPVGTIVVTLVGRTIPSHWVVARFVLVAVAMVVLIVASAASFRLFENPVRRRLNAAFDRRHSGSAHPVFTTASRNSQ